MVIKFDLFKGIAAILGAAIGQFLGGWAITKYKLSVEGILKFMIWCTVVSILATIGFLMHCRNTSTFLMIARYRLI